MLNIYIVPCIVDYMLLFSGRSSGNGRECVGRSKRDGREERRSVGIPDGCKRPNGKRRPGKSLLHTST